jgi:hypothetical protein
VFLIPVAVVFVLLELRFRLAIVHSLIVPPRMRVLQFMRINAGVPERLSGTSPKIV